MAMDELVKTPTTPMIDLWFFVLYAGDLIRHRVQHHYWPIHNNKNVMVPRSMRQELLWICGRT